MKLYLILIGLCITSQIVKAQDVIVKKDGTTIISKVLEVNETNLKYKKFKNPQGPTYSIFLSEIMSVNYENDEKDTFSQNENSTKQDVSTTNQNNQSNENDHYIKAINNKPYSYIGKVESKKAKWQYCIVKVHEDSKCMDRNALLSFSLKTTYYEKFSGRKVLTTNIYFKIKNISDNIIYIDLGNSFFRDGTKSYSFYKNSVTTVTKGKEIGANANIGTVTNAIGIGGVVGNIANGINVGGGKSSSASTTIYEQRIIAIAPNSEYEFPESVFYQSEPFYKVDCDCTIGGVDKFTIPSLLSQTLWGFIVTYSTKEDISNAVTMNMGLYLSEGVGLPGIGWNSFWINTDRYFNYSNGEPNFYIRRLK